MTGRHGAVEPVEGVEARLPKGWLYRIGAATLVVLAVVTGGTWVFTRTTDLLVMGLTAFFLAFAMLPAVDRLSRRGWRRGAATATVMFGGGLVMVVFLVSIITVFIGQVTELVARVPGYAETVTEWLNDTFGIVVDSSGLTDEVPSIEAFLEDNFAEIVGGAAGFASSVFGLVFRALTVGLFLFYILADAPKWRAALLSRWPMERQAELDNVLTITIDKVGGYFYSRGLLAGVSALFHFAVFVAIELPYPLAMALWVGVISQFIPTVGTYLAGVVPVVVALLEDPGDVVWVLVAVLVYQQIENYLIQPRITASTLQLHPAIAFASAIAGANLLGGLGAILALPVAATISALVQTYSRRFDLIESELWETPDQYEARMAELKGTKREAWAGRRRRFRPSSAKDEEE